MMLLFSIVLIQILSSNSISARNNSSIPTANEWIAPTSVIPWTDHWSRLVTGWTPSFTTNEFYDNGTTFPNETINNWTTPYGSTTFNQTDWNHTTESWFGTTNFTFPNSTANSTENSTAISTIWNTTTTLNFTNINTTNFNSSDSSIHNVTQSLTNFTTPSFSVFANSTVNSTLWTEATNFTGTTNTTLSHGSITPRFTNTPTPHFITPKPTTTNFQNSISETAQPTTPEPTTIPTTPTTVTDPDPDTEQFDPTTPETPRNVSKPYSVGSKFFDPNICKCSLSTKRFLNAIDHVCCINQDFQDSANRIPIHEAFLFELNNSANQNYSLLKKQQIRELHIIDSGIYVELIEHYEVLEKVYIHNTKVGQLLLDNLVLNAMKLETLYLDRVNVLNATVQRKSQKFQLFNFKFPPESHLKVLSLVNCDIHTLLGVNLTMNVTQLQMLSLAYNNLTTLDNPKFFPENAPHFRHLDLSYNQLRHLDKGSIPETIKILNLSGNLFKQLKFEVFQHFWSMGSEFWIMNNVLNCTHNEEIHGQQNGDATLWIDKFVFKRETDFMVYGNFCSKGF